MGRASSDEPFLFKTKSPRSSAAGGGFFVQSWSLRVSEAWATLGEGNGVASESELHAAITRYRLRNGSAPDPDPTIGCVVLRNLFFAAPGDDLAPPPHWGGTIVQGKTYSTDDPDYDYVAHAFRAFSDQARVDLVWDQDLVEVDGTGPADRYGARTLTQHRLGQGSFRLAVLGAYRHRCAVTGTRMSPVLHAAHIRPYASGGEHRVVNGMALRSDMHTLYDRGYVGIDPDYKLRVSPWLAEHFGNGAELYSRESRGEVIALPSVVDERPGREALEWHMDRVFLSA